MNEIVYTGEKAPVYFFPGRHLHSFCIGVYLTAGSMYESDAHNGITHLYEHAVFRNIKKRYEKDFYELLTENAISFNASTYKEFVYFEIAGAPSGIDFAADIVEHLFDPLILSMEEYRSEKKRIKAEIREESEFSTLQYFADSKLWNATSLANTISGYCTTLDHISLKQLNEFRERTVTKGNVFVYVTGCASDSDIDKIRRAATKMNVYENGTLRDNTAPVPSDFESREREIHFKQSDYHLVRMSFDIDNSKCAPAVRDLIYSALFEGEDAMFFQQMSERESLIYSYDSTLEQYKNVSCIKFQYEISPKNLASSFECVVRMLGNIKKGDFRFDNSLKKLLTKWELMQDEAANLNWALAYTNHILGDSHIDMSSEKLSLYDGLDVNAVMAAAEEIFTRKNLVCAVKGKKRNFDSAALSAILDGLGD